MGESVIRVEAERLLDGRVVSPFDAEIFEIVAGLTLRARAAREAIAREGDIIDDGKGFPVEHPAVVLEKRASAELRGWVKDRPDLFGENAGAEEDGGDLPMFTGFSAVM